MQLGGEPPATIAWSRTLITLIDRLDSDLIDDSPVIPWACPVPSFGDLSTSVVATVGLNPSNREFMDESGQELQGGLRRFPTLSSLDLRRWADVHAGHLRQIIEACRSYFSGRPYLTWFNKLNEVVAGAQASYFDADHGACHVDLIPYATSRKWTELSARERSRLLTSSGDALGCLLRDSSIRVLVLNGASVVKGFQDAAGLRLDRQEIQAWSLARGSSGPVSGFSVRGTVDTLFGTSLGREVLVLGFNHNLQSSFGVNREVVIAIRSWIARSAQEAFG